MKENLKKYLVEVIGTFFLVLTIICCSFTAQGLLTPFAVAAVIMIMVYSGGHISGGHYNPAISFAACLRGALSFKQFIPYVIAQCLGASLAVLVFYLMIGKTNVFYSVDYKLKALLIAETLFTFALCYVVLQTATTKETKGNSYYGLAIGFTVFVAAITVGGTFCAGAFNPAVALPLGMLGAVSWKIAGITTLANLIGGALAALAFKLTYTECKEEN